MIALGNLSPVVTFLTAGNENADKTRILGFDLQTLFQVGAQLVAVLLLFYLLARLLFNPVREILKKRREEIASSYDHIEKETHEVEALKKDYEAKIRNIKAEADKIMAQAHSKAVAREDEIVKEAHEEANRIMQRAHIEIEREREQMKDDIRNEIVEVATLMAGKFVESSLSEEKQRVLINETLNEMGEDTWQD